MSATSASKKSEPTDDHDTVRFFQGMINKIEEIPGVTAQRMTIYSNGQQVAVLAITGCIWVDDKLVLANAGSAAGSTGKEGGNAGINP